jgi:hypothetical protein
MIGGTRNHGDLFDSRSTLTTKSLLAAAVQWAERIIRKIDGVFPK